MMVRPDTATKAAFEIGAMDIPGARVVWCRGELDISSEEAVVAEIARALGRPVTSIVLDLRQLTFADATVIPFLQSRPSAAGRQRTRSIHRARERAASGRRHNPLSFDKRNEIHSTPAREWRRQRTAVSRWRRLGAPPPADSLNTCHPVSRS